MEFRLPHLTNDGLAVRPAAPQDAVAYARAFTDDHELGKLLGVEADPDEAAVRDSIARQAGGLADRSYCKLTIAEVASDAFLGEILIHSIQAQHRRAELGFWVVPDRRNEGIAQRALSAVIDWLFDELALLRLEITTTPDNPAVPALANRLGFAQEGVLRSRDIERGRRLDILWFGLLREEWPPPPSD